MIHLTPRDQKERERESLIFNVFQHNYIVINIYVNEKDFSQIKLLRLKNEMKWTRNFIKISITSSDKMVFWE